MTRCPKTLLAAGVIAIAATHIGARSGWPDQSTPAVTAEGVANECPLFDQGAANMIGAAERAKRLAQLLAEAPYSTDTMGALLEAGRPADALRVARRIVESSPDRIAAAIELITKPYYRIRQDAAQNYAETLKAVIAAARTHVADLSKPDGAMAAYRLAIFDRMNTPRDKRQDLAPLQTFAAEYAGTEAATLAELDVLLASVTTGTQSSDALAPIEAFARSHAGTCAGARALASYASALARGSYERLPAGTDPTARILRALALASELEVPAVTRCAVEPNAIDLVAGIYAYRPAYAPGNLDRQIDAYTRFIRAHFTEASGDSERGLGYAISGRLYELYTLRGDGLAGLEAFLAQLEREGPAPDAAAYLWGAFYIRDAQRRGALPERAMVDKSRAVLERVANRGRGLYNRKALATLAWVEHAFGDVATAREHYARYVKAYPESPYAWVAALNVGICDQESGNWAAAAEQYRQTVAAYGSLPPAAVLAHAYRGRTFDALSEFPQAAREYEAALAGWHTDYGSLSYAIGEARRPALPPSDRLTYRSPLNVTPERLRERLAQLTRTQSSPGGVLLEQGRWRFENGERQKAADLLDRFDTEFATSPNLAEARYLAHEARLYVALELLSLEGEADAKAGAAGLDALASAPYDFPVCAAKIAVACTRRMQGRPDEADALMRAALDEWRARQAVPEPASAIGKDIAAIRVAVFQPMGGSVYGTTRWNAFAWPQSLPPYLVVNPDVAVILADGTTTRMSVPQRFADFSTVLLVTTEQTEMLGEIMRRLGGTKTREGRILIDRGVMETPVVPVGPSTTLIEYLATFFEARAGHWGGWEFLTYPNVTKIEFLDDARTKARASVTIGYSGADVLLEKIDGAWKAVRLVNQWIT